MKTSIALRRGSSRAFSPPRPACSRLRGFRVRPGPVRRAPSNIVVVFTDDQGWGDSPATGRRTSRPLHIDRLAAEGMRFTDFYASQPVCLASRASLLTGCHANRLGIRGVRWCPARGTASTRTNTRSRRPSSRWATRPPATASGISATSDRSSRPTRASTSTTASRTRTTCGRATPSRRRRGPPADLRRRRGVRVRTDRVHRRSRRPGHGHAGTDRSLVDFIDRHADRPFLLYVPHSMPHVPLGAGRRSRARCTAPTVT